MKGSPPSNRHTLCPAASSSRTRLRTLTISENPTEAKRLATGGIGVSVIPSSFSNHLPPSGTHDEVQNHSENRQENDEKSPQDLGSSVGAALQKRDQGDDVEHQDQESPD